MSKFTPAIPEPSHAIGDLYQAVLALKQAVEILTKQRGPARKADAAVTWQDLVDLGLIDADQIPK